MKRKLWIYFWILYLLGGVCVGMTIWHCCEWAYKFLPTGLHWRWYRTVWLLSVFITGTAVGFYWRFLFTLMVEDTTHIVTRKNK